MTPEELYKKAMDAFFANPNKTTFKEELKKLLKEYNDEVAKAIYDAVLGVAAAAMASDAIDYVPATLGQLSDMLYNNADSLMGAVESVLNDHFKTKSTLDKIREALYDGYGYGELLDIKPKDLPKYLGFDRAKAEALKTEHLRIAYLNVMDAKNDDELRKAMRVALEERARYYAMRIARTEEARAFNMSNLAKQLEDGVKYVKWTMSSLHKTACVCEYYASQDVGYGAGVYKLASAPMPVYSSHPNCRCSLRSVYREPVFKYTPKKEYGGKAPPPVLAGEFFSK